MGSALIVNPCDRHEVSGAIHRALSMGFAERRRRWEKLMEGVTSEDVAALRESFVEALRDGPKTAPTRLANDAA